jgi:excisionase family DNA binding protein
MGRDDKVVELRQWYTVDELAEREGVSTRTIYRRLKRGDIEKRETEDGTRYRPATETTDKGTDTADSHDTVTDVSSVSSSKDEGADSGVSTDTESVSGVSKLADLIREQTDRIATLERKVGELEAENEQLRNDLEEMQPTEVKTTAEAAPNNKRSSRAAELVQSLRETADNSN